MSDLPEPLTPADCDLRGMEWMPLHGHKLYGSDFDAIASDAEYRAAQRLWWAAWQQQVPAASLPDDDRVLAHAAGYGRDPKGWAKIKSVALHAFIKCSDGRLYHRFLSPEAVVAWEMRRDAVEEKESTKERQRRHREARRDRFATLRERGIDVSWNATTDHLKMLLSQSNDATVTQLGRTCHSDSDAPDTAKTGQDRDSKKVRTEATPLTPTGVSDPPGLWSEGLATLSRLSGKPASKCRSMLGQWRKSAKNDEELLVLIEHCDQQSIVDPFAWITKAIAAKPKETSGLFEGKSLYDMPGVVWHASTGKPMINGDFLDVTTDWALEASGTMRDATSEDVSIVSAWMTDGYEPVTIRDAIRKIALRNGYERPSSLRYFDRAVREQPKGVAA
jgi:uncharacterized protein YdaU (DUF1376 family)